MGPRSFPGRLRRPARRPWAAKYRPGPLGAALEEVLGERKLGKSRVPLVMPSYDLTNDDVHLFRTPHAPRLSRDCEDLMVGVALATSAAPTYLPGVSVTRPAPDRRRRLGQQPDERRAD